MITEAIHNSAAENKTEESKPTLSLVRVKVEEAAHEATDMMPKWPCGGILVGD